MAAAAGRERCLGSVITIGAGMYEPGHAIRTDRGQIGFKIGEHDGKVTERAERLAKIMCDVAPTKVTTNLWGERWSKLSVNCMANGLAGLSGLGSAEVRTRDGVRRVAIHLAAETIKVGRARGHEVEPIWGITAQRFVDAAEGRAMAEVERDMAERAKELAGGRPSLLQDVMRGRRTEVQYLNGYVGEQGRQVGDPHAVQRQGGGADHPRPARHPEARPEEPRAAGGHAEDLGMARQLTVRLPDDLVRCPEGDRASAAAQEFRYRETCATRVPGRSDRLSRAYQISRSHREHVLQSLTRRH